MRDHDPHVSDLRWDRLLAGELAAADRDAAHAHAEGCVTCAARFRELSAAREEFALRAVPGFVRAKPRRMRWWWSAPIAALAAAAVLVIVLRGAPSPHDGTTKGRPVKLLLAGGQPDALAPLSSHDAIHPGDYLQAGYSAERAGFGAVLSRDGAGAANAYVPSHGDAMVPLPAGSDLSYPESTLLDAVVGDERVIILWCEAAHPVQPLVQQLATGRFSPPAGCETREVILEKRAR